MFPEVCSYLSRYRPTYWVCAARRACDIGWCGRLNLLVLIQGDSDLVTVEAISHPQLQLPRISLVDTEKTYSGLTAGCAAAGRAGCKLIEFTGDGATGDDVKNLINDAHDVVDSLSRFTHPANISPSQMALELYRSGYEVPAPPGFLTSTISDLDTEPRRLPHSSLAFQSFVHANAVE